MKSVFRVIPALVVSCSVLLQAGYAVAENDSAMQVALLERGDRAVLVPKSEPLVTDFSAEVEKLFDRLQPLMERRLEQAVASKLEAVLNDVE